MLNPPCCDGWGETIDPDGRVVACRVCHPDAYLPEEPSC